MQIDFRPSAAPTLGVEWEVALVDARSRDLVSRAGDVLALLPERVAAGHLHRELLRNTAEVVTGICADVPTAMAELAEHMQALREAAEPLGLRLFSAGMHPFATWKSQQVSGGERYATLIDRTRWWGRQMVIYGVHVHVGMPVAERVLPVLNSMLRYYPHLQALSAASPFYEGHDTGYASNRALLFQQLPTAGLPFQFDTWPDYESYVGDLMATGVIDVLKEIRWDIRPSPYLGTIEVRICDAMPTFECVAATTALTHCLLVDLDTRLAAGEQLPTLPPWHVQENKWRSARYGLDSIIITDAANTERLVTDDLADLLEQLAPVAKRLNCTDDLARVWDIVTHGASYQRQRAVDDRSHGDLTTVVDALTAELANSLDRWR